MAISLTEIIAALEAKSNATDSSSSISDILRLTQASEQVSDGTILYDSAGVMPTDSAFIGALAATSNGTIYFYNGTAWNAVDSAETIAAAAAYTFQGSSYGYASSNFLLTPGSLDIQKFSFVTDGNATEVGDLTVSRTYAVGQTSSTHGYTSIGYWGPTAPTPSINWNTIDKFPFSVDANATDVGDMPRANFGQIGYSSSAENGYVAGQGGSTTTTPTTNQIEKFSFSVDANGTTVGDITEGRSYLTGQSSSTHGYTSGGTPIPLASNTIEKYLFAADANATDVGDLATRNAFLAGLSSADNGYTAGGRNPLYNNVIQKFPFATDANGTDVGDLINTGGAGATPSGDTHGYKAGDIPSKNVIQKFSFATDANATDVGDLVTAFSYGASQQV